MNFDHFLPALTAPVASSFSMALNGNHFDVTDGTRTYKVPDMRYANEFNPATRYAGQLTTVATMATGTGNHAQALSDAITAAQTSAQYLAGEAVCVAIPAGTFTFTQKVEFAGDRIRICGAGKANTIIEYGFDVGDFSGVFDFTGNFGGHSQALSQNIAEGDTRIYINNLADWNVRTGTGPGQRGDIFNLQKRYEPSWFAGIHAKSNTGGSSSQTIYAVQMTEVIAKGTDGTGDYIDLRRPMLFDLDAGQSYRVYRSPFAQDNGLEGMTIRHTADLGAHTNRNNVHIKSQSHFYVNDCLIDCPNGHYIDNDWICNCLVENTDFNDGWYRGSGGGRSYIGWWKSTDCSMKNCNGTFGRHIAFQNFARGNYIGSCNFTGMDLNYHAEFPGDNVIEQCTINDNHQALSKQGEVNRDIYEQIVTSINTLEDTPSALSIADNRNAVWNCDFDGTTFGGGIFDGGGMRDFTFAYNRLMVEGGGFTSHAWIPSSTRTPLLAISEPSERNKYVGNEFWIAENGNNDIHAVMAQTSFNATGSPDVHLLDNNFYNWAASLQVRDTDGVTQDNNTWVASGAGQPAAPTAPQASLLAYQQTNFPL